MIYIFYFGMGKSMQRSDTMKIIPIAALSDNYIWVGRKENDVFIVDPGESKQVIDYIKKENLNLKAILLTHKHADHVGGVHEIKKVFGAEVYGPIETAQLNDYTLKEDDELELMGEKFKILKTAGHTEEHISYLTNESLFCGDALFLAGCGRVFTGDYAEQYKTMQKFKKISDEVKVYPAHEYSLKNLKFAKEVAPCEDLEIVTKKCEELRQKNLATLPSTIEQERKINPFFKAKDVEELKKFRDIRDRY